MPQPPNDPEDLLDAIVDRLQQQAVPPMPEALIGPVTSPIGPQPAREHSLRRWIMQRPVQFSAAVSAVAVVALFLAFGSFGPRASFAFGDVQKAIGAKKSMTYQLEITNDDKHVIVKVSRLGADQARSDWSDGEVQIINSKDGVWMTLSRPKRTAVIQQLYPSTELSKTMTDWFTQFRTLPEKATRRLGEREYEGRKVIDFLVPLDDRAYTVTVDAQTKLPVRMEFAETHSAATGRSYHELLTDFVFDAPLDESLFALTPPPGYSVQRLSLPTGTPRDDRSLAISPETGIGPVRFGMTQDEIVKLLGKPDQVGTSESTMPAQTETGRYSKPQTYVTTMLKYDSRGFELAVQSGYRIAGISYPGYGLLSIHVFNQVDRMPTVRDFQGITREGIRLGATPDEVLKVYGKPDQPIEHGSFAGLSYQKRGWMFEFRHGKLSGIQVRSPRPADQLRSSKTYTQQPAAARRK